jgi:hypothetical protein
MKRKNKKDETVPYVEIDYLGWIRYEIVVYGIDYTGDDEDFPFTYVVTRTVVWGEERAKRIARELLYKHKRDEKRKAKNPIHVIYD